MSQPEVNFKFSDIFRTNEFTFWGCFFLYLSNVKTEKRKANEEKSALSSFNITETIMGNLGLSLDLTWTFLDCWRKPEHLVWVNSASHCTAMLSVVQKWAFYYANLISYLEPVKIYTFRGWQKIDTNFKSCHLCIIFLSQIELRLF